MKRKFTVVIKREGDEYVARCAEVPGAEGRGRDKNDALKKIRAAIIKKLEGGSDAGSAPFPHPVSPPPRGPIIVEEAHERPND
jgi:predicted RNase H-like HicB family nuclease